jgi:hypothetical protein
VHEEIVDARRRQIELEALPVVPSSNETETPRLFRVEESARIGIRADDVHVAVRRQAGFESLHVAPKSCVT